MFNAFPLLTDSAFPLLAPPRSSNVNGDEGKAVNLSSLNLFTSQSGLCNPTAPHTATALPSLPSQRPLSRAETAAWARACKKICRTLPSSSPPLLKQRLEPCQRAGFFNPHERRPLH